MPTLDSTVINGSAIFVTQSGTSGNQSVYHLTGMDIPPPPVGQTAVIDAIWLTVQKAYGLTGLPPGEYEQRGVVRIGGYMLPTSPPVNTTPYPAAGTYDEPGIVATRDLPSTLAQGATAPTPISGTPTPGADATVAGPFRVRLTGWNGVSVPSGPVETLHISQLGAAYYGSSPSESFTLARIEVEYHFAVVGGGGGAAPADVAFTASATTGVGSLGVQLNATSDSAGASYTWNLDELGTVSGQNIARTFPVGVYTVSVTATNAYGSTTSTTQTITVTAAPGGGGSGLKAAATGAGKRIGTALNELLLAPGNIDQAYLDRALLHFNSVTFENAFKQDMIGGTGGTRNSNWATADMCLDWAEANNMEVRAHTLIWGQEWFTNLLPWLNNVTDPTSFANTVKAYVRDWLIHFQGRVTRVDLINEAFTQAADTGLLDNNQFVQRMGPDYIEQIFTYAHSVDPNIELWWNDTGMEYNPVNCAAWVARITSMVNAGVPIHGVGLQLHLFWGDINWSDLINAVNAFKALGLKVAFTEVDVPIADGVSAFPMGDPPALAYRSLTDQANIYVALAAALFDGGGANKDLGEEITVWGVDDLHTWYDPDNGHSYAPQNAWDIGPRGQVPHRPLLIDRSLAIKPAYTALANKFSSLTQVDPEEPPVALFSRTPVSGSIPMTVSFVNESTGPNATYSWDFGNGQTSALRNPPSVQYNDAQTYQVALTVTNPFGTSTVVHTVIANTAQAVAPVSLFSITEGEQGEAPLVVRVLDQSSGTITSRIWSLDNGPDINVLNPVFTMTSSGVHTITLRVANAAGSSTYSRQVTVSPTVVAPPPPGGGGSELGHGCGWGLPTCEEKTATHEEKMDELFCTLMEAGAGENVTQLLTQFFAPPEAIDSEQLGYQSLLYLLQRKPCGPAVGNNAATVCVEGGGCGCGDCQRTGCDDPAQCNTYTTGWNFVALARAAEHAVRLAYMPMRLRNLADGDILTFDADAVADNGNCDPCSPSALGAWVNIPRSQL